MGQRLNIEIYDGGKCLANAYYHWDAYTDAAATQVSKVLKEIQKAQPGENKLLYAVRLLEATGAGLTLEEIEYARNVQNLKNSDFRECEGRNAGLIAVSAEGIQQTRFWEEGRVTIYLDEGRINFAVFDLVKRWDWRRERREDGESDDFDALPKIEVDFTDIKFDDFEDVRRQYLNGDSEEIVSAVDPMNVICRIQ